MILSIGDGANDVAMIQDANIGCGLFDLEGSQAAMSVDYAFGQFRFLTKLLWCMGIGRISVLQTCIVTFSTRTLSGLLSCFGSSRSTTLMQHICTNYIHSTSLPVIVMGAFDQGINANAALAFPQLCVRGIRGLEYTRTKFWLYIYGRWLVSARVSLLHSVFGLDAGDCCVMERQEYRVPFGLWYNGFGGSYSCGQHLCWD